MSLRGTSQKRACDACKVRKVRCSSTPPCTGCLAIGTPCTFNKHQGTRGPRRLRAKTIQQIAETQRCAGEGQAARLVMDHDMRQVPSPSASATANATASASRPEPSPPVLPTISRQETALPPLVASPPAVAARSEIVASLTPVATLVLHLCVYRLRMFPVWPIVEVGDLMTALQKDGEDMEAYALANAVAAATIAQLRLNPLKNSAEVVTAESMESEVQRVRAIGHRELNLNQLRIAFFLHVYHENLDPGGVNSLLHLREAITMAQMMGLHKESSYRSLSLDDQQFRKRALWLLFVTERAIAILHGLSIVLNSNISFPAMEYDEDVSILPAFWKLVNLYWTIDKPEVFEMLQNSGLGSSTSLSINQDDLILLQKKLHEIPVEFSAINDVQAADICVTRTWISTVLWRVITIDRSVLPLGNPFTSMGYPTEAANDLLDVISSLPTTAIEAHGSSMELKIYEIACSVVDSLAGLGSNGTPASMQELNPRDVLNQLQSILSSCRGGNTILVDRIKDRLAGMEGNSNLPVAPNTLVSEDTGSQDERRERRSHSDQAVRFEPSTEAQQSEDPALRFTAISMPDSANTASPEFSSQQHQFLPSSWDYIAKDTQLEFDGDFEQSNPSMALDRFLGNTMGSNWMSMQTSPGPVSQWL